MPELTRRRYPERPDCWHVFYGDVQVGTIGIRAGVPNDVDQWGWTCGFYPGCDPGQHTIGSAPDFDQARVGFEADWNALRPTRTEANFQEYRDGRNSYAEMRAKKARGEKLPSQIPSSMMTCPCGVRFDSHVLAQNLIHVPHITAARAADGIRR